MDILNNLIQQIQPLLQIIPIFSGGIITYVAPNAFRNFSIRKKNSQRNWSLANKISYLQPNFHPIKPIVKIKLDKQNLKKLEEILNNTTYPKELIDIVQTFKNYVSPENFITCLKNLQTVKIKQTTLENNLKKCIKNFLSAFPVSGNYTNGTINLYSSTIKSDVLSHEFLHMASAKNPFNIGFRQISISDDKEIGRGLNEGYTELLNQRIFNPHSMTYKYNVKITKLLETFFDNPEDMTYAYFNGSLQSIYQTFSKYGSKEEFLEIMTNLDNLATTKPSIYNEIISVKTQFKLYQIIKRTNNKDKISHFEQILDENNLTRLLRNNKLVLTTPYQKAKTK